MPLPTKILSVLALLVPTIICQITIAPFSDGQCVNALTNFTFDGSEDMADPSFSAGLGYPNYANFDNLVFTGANAPSNGPGYDVYWSVDGLGPGCRAAFLLPFIQKDYGATSMTPAEGLVVLNVASTGCYYSNLPVDAQLQITFCCGTGDCTPLAAGNQQIVDKRDVEDEKADLGVARELHDASTEAKHITKEIDNNNQKSWSIGSIASRVIKAVNSLKRSGLQPRDTTCTTLECFDAAWASCTIDAGSPYQVAGSQISLSDPQPCPGGAPGGTCSISGSAGFTTGTSLTTSQDTTTTTTGGVTISQSAGVDWPIDLVFTATASLSFAKAVSNSVATTLTNSTTTTVTNTLGQISGTTAFLTFTPSYTCYSPDVDCTSTPDVSDPGIFTQICWPNFLPSGAPSGTFSLVYTD